MEKTGNKVPLTKKEIHELLFPTRPNTSGILYALGVDP